jgi:hypothetical protein
VPPDLDVKFDPGISILESRDWGRRGAVRAAQYQIRFPRGCSRLHTGKEKRRVVNDHPAFDVSLSDPRNRRVSGNPRESAA